MLQFTLREEILVGKNFGGLAHPQNLMRFGGIYFGGWRKKLNLAGFNFGRRQRITNFQLSDLVKKRDKIFE